MSITVFWLLVAYVAGVITVAYMLGYRSTRRKNENKSLTITLPTVKNKKKPEPPKELEAREMNLFYPEKIDLDQAEGELIKFFKGGMKGAKTSRENGILITRMPFTVKEPEGYELPKFDSKTGKLYYSDGTIAEHAGLRKIPDYHS